LKQLRFKPQVQNFLTPLKFLGLKNVVLTFNSFNWHIHYWRNFNDIHICASVFRKLHSHIERSACSYNHLIGYEEFTVRRVSLNMVPADTETHQRSN